MAAALCASLLRHGAADDTKGFPLHLEGLLFRCSGGEFLLMLVSPCGGGLDRSFLDRSGYLLVDGVNLLLGRRLSLG